MSEECTHDCSSCKANCDHRAPAHEPPHPKSRIRKVIGVVSGKGGVGKSMTSAMLAVSMRRLGYKAGVLDADITGPSIPRLFGVKGVTSLEVYVADTDATNSVVDALEGELDRAFNYKDDSYRVINMESLLSVMDTMMGLMTNLLAGIASIALLVGGIGIMNMMLVSVTERTSEIGLRKALGARPRSIQAQFLMESVILSLLGGFIGVILGVLVSMLLASAMDIAFVLSPGAIALGVSFSLAVGVVFGWAPARKASNLNPIDALRSM